MFPSKKVSKIVKYKLTTEVTQTVVNSSYLGQFDLVSLHNQTSVQNRKYPIKLLIRNIMRKNDRRSA